MEVSGLGGALGDEPILQLGKLRPAEVNSPQVCREDGQYVPLMEFLPHRAQRYMKKNLTRVPGETGSVTGIIIAHR